MRSPLHSNAASVAAAGLCCLALSSSSMLCAGFQPSVRPPPSAAGSFFANTSSVFTRRLRRTSSTLSMHLSHGHGGHQHHHDASAERTPCAAKAVTLLAVAVNLVLSIGKGVVGVSCHSSALVADAAHSLSDLLSDFVTLWAYGKGRLEAAGALFLSVNLIVTGASVGFVSSYKFTDILSSQLAGGAALGHRMQQVPTVPALAMAGLSILSKEWLFRITKRVGDKLRSQIVIANAWHHRSDAWSSMLSMGSIGLAMAAPGRLLAADAAAGLIVSMILFTTGAEIFVESIKDLGTASVERGLGAKQRAARQAVKVMGYSDMVGYADRYILLPPETFA